MPNLLSNLAPSFPHFFIEEIHEKTLDDVSQVDIRVLATEISENPDYVLIIDPETTEHYDYLVQLAISIKSSVFTRIPSEHVTRKQLQTFLEHTPATAAMAEAYHPGQFHRFFDVEMATDLIRRKISMAAPARNEYSFFIKDHLVTDQALRAGIMNNPYFGYIAVQRGRHHVIKSLMEDGFWPEGKWIKKKPVRLKTAIKYYLDAESDPNLPYGPLLWYKEHILSFPAKNVVKEMCSAGYPEKLDEFFTREFIAPFTTGNGMYKRSCLMMDLGV